MNPLFLLLIPFSLLLLIFWKMFYMPGFVKHMPKGREFFESGEYEITTFRFGPMSMFGTRYHGISKRRGPAYVKARLCALARDWSTDKDGRGIGYSYAPLKEDKSYTVIAIECGSIEAWVVSTNENQALEVCKQDERLKGFFDSIEGTINFRTISEEEQKNTVIGVSYEGTDELLVSAGYEEAKKINAYESIQMHEKQMTKLPYLLCTFE